MAGYFHLLLTWMIYAVCFVVLSILQYAYAVDVEIGENGLCPGGAWDVSTSTCTTSGFTVGEKDALVIPSGVIFINAGILNNAGTLTNTGTFFNNGILDSNGILDNTGTLDSTGTLDNTGIFENFGALFNTGTLINCGIFTDTGTFSGSSMMPCDAGGDGIAD